MLEFEILILKLGSIDGLSTGTIVVGKVSSLAHEARDDAMEGRACIAVSLLSRAEGAKVLNRFGNNVRPKFHNNAASWLAADGHVKVALGVGPIRDMAVKWTKMRKKFDGEYQEAMRDNREKQVLPSTIKCVASKIP
jgi:prepilin-type processing-associated H-X9-DG protein